MVDDLGPPPADLLETIAQHMNFDGQRRLLDSHSADSARHRQGSWWQNLFRGQPPEVSIALAPGSQNTVRKEGGAIQPEGRPSTRSDARTTFDLEMYAAETDIARSVVPRSQSGAPNIQPAKPVQGGDNV